MSRFPPDRSEILSLLLDEVTGSQEAIDIRHDFCQLMDGLSSTLFPTPGRLYYTGSKAEGLDLPGSDDDFMMDINTFHKIEVVQSESDISNTSIYDEFLLCTENVKPGFALLRRIRQHTFTNNLIVTISLKIINNVEFLSSDEYVKNILHGMQSFDQTLVRQGPSMEQRLPDHGPSEPGTDRVMSIRCYFWPTVASEWIQRSRSFGWPTSDVISSIVNFGCHLVAVGHPKSETKLLEWRLSFSIAEKHLVWSFNHVQIQCYAVLKIILKQYIKLRCSPQNQVLCSYFIKTFLFWKYETTPLNFWCKSNFRECIIYLLRDFSKCIHEGVIRHYFLPRFNLLSVKLTPEAQTELMQLYDIVIQNDISILKECEAMRNVWSNFLLANENQMKIINNIRKNNLLLTDELIMTKLRFLIQNVRGDSSYYHKSTIDFMLMKIPSIVRLWCPYIDDRFTSSVLPLVRNGIEQHVKTFYLQSFSTKKIRDDILNLPCKTSLKFFLLKYLCLKTHIDSLISLHQGNRKNYILQQINGTNASFDISSTKLWYAIMVFKTLDYNSTLSIVNRLLSSIPPFAFYEQMSDETKCMYVDKFLNSPCTQIQRAREALLVDIMFEKCMTEIVPLAIQIELYFCRVDGLNYIYNRVWLSPYVCAYYLMFLCYHELGQYDNRDHALRQLIDVVNNREQCGGRRDFSYNIAGHCLLVAGQIDRARSMFIRSRRFREKLPISEKCNSANWYIRNFC